MKYLRRVVAIGGLLWLGAGVGPVHAHADLDSSDPSPSAVLTTAPDEIFLDFSEPVTTSADSVELFDQDGSSIAIDIARVSPDDATVVLVGGLPDLEDGLYVVAWRVVSADGHVAEGAFTFQVGEGASVVGAGGLVSTVLSDREAQSGLGLGIAASRFLAYLTVVSIAGATMFMAAAKKASLRVWSIAVWSLAVLTSATLAHFLLQGPHSHGGRWSDVFDAAMWSLVLDTRLGVALVSRLGLVAVLALLLKGVAPTNDRRDRLAGSWWRSLTALSGAGIVLTFSAGGHPSASPLAGPSVAVDAVHLAAVALWIGGLIMLVVAGLDDSERVRQFSRLATWSAPIALATGIWQVRHLAGGLAVLGESTWGRMVLLKVALAVGALTLGAVARTLVIRIAEESPGRGALRRIMMVEVSIALVVFGTTAFLVAEPPRATATAMVVETTIVQGSLIADVTVTPGVVGNNEIHVVISPTGGTLERMSSATMRMIHPDPSLPPVAVPVAETGPNHFVGNVALLSPGTWTLEILVQPDPSTSIRLTTDVPVED